MLKGKTAIVTGSTSGIGLGIARALATAGCDVMLNGFGEAAAIETGPGISFSQVVAATEAELAMSDRIPEMNLAQA